MHKKRGQTSNCPNLLVYLYFAETCHLQITEMMILLEFHHPFLNANLGETPKGSNAAENPIWLHSVVHLQSSQI